MDDSFSFRLAKLFNNKKKVKHNDSAGIKDKHFDKYNGMPICFTIVATLSNTPTDTNQ